jgi:hypothetical protein
MGRSSSILRRSGFMGNAITPDIGFFGKKLLCDRIQERFPPWRRSRSGSIYHPEEISYQSFADKTAISNACNITSGRCFDSCRLTQFNTNTDVCN